VRIMINKIIQIISIMLMIFAFYGCSRTAPSNSDITTEDTALSTVEVEITEMASEQEIEQDINNVSSTSDNAQDSNVIKLKDDGISGEAVDSDGMKKDPIITNKSIDQKYTVGDFEITVVSAQLAVLSADNDEVAEYLEIETNRDYVLFGIGISVENTSDKNESIYPNRSTIVTNTKEQVDSLFALSDDVGGTFYGNVVKDGQIYFICPKSDINELNHIKWIIDAPVVDDRSEGESLIIEFDMIK